MDTSSVVMSVIILTFIMVIMIVGVYLIGNFTNQVGGWGVSTGEKAVKVGENALQTAGTDSDEFNLNKVYKQDTLSVLAGELGLDSNSVVCQNKADYIKFSEHSIYVKNVLPDTLYCHKIEEVYTPKQSESSDLTRYNFFGLFFMLKDKGSGSDLVRELYVAVVDGGGFVHSKTLVVAPSVDTIEYSVYFGNVKYWGGLNNDGLDDVKLKLSIVIKNDKGNVDVYIVSYIMNSLDN